MQQTFGQKIFNNLIKLLADKNFLNEIKSIRDKFNISENGISDDFLEQDRLNIIGACAEELEKLRVKYRLNEHYGVFLIFVVIFAKQPDKVILDNTLPFGLITTKEKSGLNCPAIKIYPETTRDDIIKNWSLISKHRKNIYGYEIVNQRPLKNTWRYIHIAKMKKWGWKNKDIATMINKLYPQAKSIVYADVAKIINKNKRSAGKELKILTKIK